MYNEKKSNCSLYSESLQDLEFNTLHDENEVVHQRIFFVSAAVVDEVCIVM